MFFFSEALSAIVLATASSDEGLTHETSAFESLYGGQLTLSTQLIKPISPVLQRGRHDILISLHCDRKHFARR